VGDLRKPFLLLAIFLMVLVVLIELGSGLILGGAPAGQALQDQQDSLEVDDVGDVSDVEEPPGRGIFTLVLVDGILAYTVILMGLSLVIPEKVQARAQGCATFILSIILIIVGIILAIITLVELIVMVTLFLAVPFGTIAYLALWGFFPRGDASILLSLIMFLKIAFVVFILLAQQRYLTMKGFMALVLTSFVCSLIVAFLQNLVPIILVSIFDDIAALIVAIIAIIWAIILLIGSIPSIIATIRLGLGSD
jgi:hypothetical protein